MSEQSPTPPGFRGKSAVMEQKPVVVYSNQRLERFRGKPEKPSDPSAHEWVSDIRGHGESRRITGRDFAAFIVDHLAGKARLEIQARGDHVKDNPDEILRILLQVFGDGKDLRALQQQFYSYSRNSEDLLSCSLSLVELYDQII